MLDLFQDAVFNTLRVMSTGLRIPVMILLVLLAAYTVFIIGTLMVEIFTEHRHLKVHMPALVDGIKKAGRDNVAATIENSSLLKRQKAALIELTKHPDLTNMMRESLAIRLISQEQDHYDSRTKQTDTIAKIGPMLGLMGTLIPLGPGIIALGQGDTYTLSTSLLTAFDTTVAGLACAAAALVISIIRKRWYKNYMSMTETLMECTLEMENSESVPAPETSVASAVSVPTAALDPVATSAASAASAYQAYDAYAGQSQQVQGSIDAMDQQLPQMQAVAYPPEQQFQQVQASAADPLEQQFQQVQASTPDPPEQQFQQVQASTPDPPEQQSQQAPQSFSEDLKGNDHAHIYSGNVEDQSIDHSNDLVLSREQQKQILSEAFKREYLDALRAGNNKEDAIVIARKKALEVLSISIRKAGEQ